MFNEKLNILRVRKDVPGVGRKLANHFNANQVTCGYRPNIKVKDNSFVFNYGRSQLPIWWEDAAVRGVKMINSPSAVGNCVNKLTTLKLLSTKEVPCLAMSTVRADARIWIDNGDKVIIRHILNGKQGKGIELVENKGDLVSAPLYTKFFDKTHEFRVHVFDGVAIDLIQKKRMGSKKRAERGIKEVDELTRNHKKGWVFAHKDLICDGGLPSRGTIEEIGIQAAEAVGADYCGVDILAKYSDNGMLLEALVCEVNSAPGMSSPTTFNAYIKAIETYMEKHK